MNKNHFSFISKAIIVLILLVISLNYKIVSAKSASDENYKPLIDQSQITWIKMVGGRDINTKVLFAGHDDDNIKKIVRMIDSSKVVGIASSHDVSYIDAARSIGMKLKTRDGKSIEIWKLYQPNSDSTGAVVSKENVILERCEKNVERFYRVKSYLLADFLLSEYTNVMPYVNIMSVSKSSNGNYIEDNDSITVSGDGCVESVVNIYIIPSSNQSVKYLVGKVVPVYGKWEWSTVISRKMEAIDGSEFEMDNGYYDIEAEIGNMRVGRSGIIRFGK